MKKAVIQAGLSVVVFLGSWMMLSQVNWVEFFEVKESKNQMEQHLGEVLIKEIKAGKELVEDDRVNEVLNDLLEALAEKNNFEAESIRLYVVKDEEVNAFALPDHQMVINTALIQEAERAEELAGVMAHEIAHFEKNHVMKKLVREMGLSVLVGLSSGGAGSDVVKDAGRLISSRAFDREQEQEADDAAVAMLNNCGVSAEHLANFLYLMADYSGNGSSAMAWLSTHPELKARAQRILENQESPEEEKALLPQDEWEALKAALGEL